MVGSYFIKFIFFLVVFKFYKSAFNKKEIDFIICFKELQSIWNDIYESYTNLMGYYNIGDSVVIEGKLYKYYNVNQIYINCIRILLMFHFTS